MVTSDVCSVFAASWISLSNAHNTKAGSEDFGEEFIPEQALDCPAIMSAACFFVGIEFIAMLCSNTSENTRMNSTKMAINKASKEKEEEEKMRLELLAKRRRGRGRAFGREDKGGSSNGGEADARGIRNVKTVGQKAIQLLEFNVTAFLGNIDMMRVRSMLLLLGEIFTDSDSGSDNGNGSGASKTGFRADEGSITLALSSLLQGVRHSTNILGIDSNGGIPEARRIQGIPVCSQGENQSNLETVFELFDIDVPSAA